MAFRWFVPLAALIRSAPIPVLSSTCSLKLIRLFQLPPTGSVAWCPGRFAHGHCWLNSRTENAVTDSKRLESDWIRLYRNNDRRGARRAGGQQDVYQPKTE